MTQSEINLSFEVVSGIIPTLISEWTLHLLERNEVRVELEGMVFISERITVLNLRKDLWICFVGIWLSETTLRFKKKFERYSTLE